MADLSDIQAAGFTKIVGSDATGVETNTVNADVNGNLQVTDYSNGPVTPGTVAAKSNLVGGQFNSSLPSLTTGQQAALQTDSAARVLIGSIFSPLPTGSNTIGAVTQSGTWTVQPGNTANTTAWLVTNLSLGSGPGAGTAATKSALVGLVFNTALPTLTNGQQAAIQGDSSSRLIIAPLTNTSIVKAQLQDNAGNGINSDNSQLLVQDVINTAGQNRAQTVTSSAAEALGAATILVNRKFLSITPTDGTIYWGFAIGVTTSTGTPILKNATWTMTVSDNVHIYVVASGSVNCRIAEGS